MATNVNVSSNFEGTLAGELFVQAFKKADTISQGAITVLPNIIGSGFLPKLSYAAGLAPYSCGWLPTGDVSYTEKELVTKKYEIKHELCKDEFHQTYQAQAQGLFSADNEIPSTIQDGILLAMTNNMGAIVDREIWQGDGSTASFAGLLGKLTADADVIKITAVASTVANVQAEIGKVYNAIPDEVANDPDLIIAVSNNIAKNYKMSQINNYLVGTPVGDKVLDFIGIKMVALNGLPNNTIVAYRVKNFAFGTGLEADFNNARVIDLDAADGSGLIRTKIVFSAGVEYSFGAEVVLYS